MIFKNSMFIINFFTGLKNKFCFRKFLFFFCWFLLITVRLLASCCVYNLLFFLDFYFSCMLLGCLYMCFSGMSLEDRLSCTGCKATVLNTESEVIMVIITQISLGIILQKENRIQLSGVSCIDA